MNITNGLLKEEAKRKINGQVFSIFAVLFVAGIVISGVQSGFSIYSSLESVMRSYRMWGSGTYLPSLDETDYLTRNMIMQSVRMLINVWGILMLPFGISLTHYIMRIARGERLPAGASIGGVFGEGVRNYGRYLGTMFVTNLLVGLWMLLLIVPGIIKAYEYIFVKYLQADNPNLTGDQCRSISSRMTYGYKWDIFFLELSFIGWSLLTAFTFGLVGIYYYPYHETTMALLYDQLREDALQRGKVMPQELGLDPAAYGMPQNGMPYAAGGYPPQYGVPVPPYGAAPYAGMPYGAPVTPPPVRNTPQMLKQMVVSRYPGYVISRSGVPALPVRDALWLVEECRLNGFVILGVDAYLPSGAFAPGHSLRMEAMPAAGANSWAAASQYLMQKSQVFELSYEILF